MLKKTQKPIVLALASLSVGISLGLLVSFLIFSPDQANQKPSPRDSVELRTPSNYKENENVTPTPRDLVEIIELVSATDRRFALYQLIEDKDSEQIEELLRRALTIENTKYLHAVQRVLFAELARVSPVNAVELVWETERIRWANLLDIVATNWSSIAPDEALREFSSLAEPWRDRTVKSILQNQGILTETELSELAESLNISEVFITWTHENKLAEVIDEPQIALNFVIEADVSDFQKRKMLTRIAQRWIEREGLDNVSSMLSLVYDVITGQRTHWRDRISLSPVVEEIASANPQLAWQQLLSLSPEVQRTFIDAIFGEWVELEPTAAIQAITSQEYLDSMHSEVRYLLRSWVRAMSGEILSHIDLVPEDFKISAVEEAVVNLAQSLPPDEVLELLSQFRLRGISTDEATVSFVRVWSQKDPDAVSQWVVQNSDLDTSRGQWMLRSALEQLALTDPEKAMEVALEQPAETALEQTVVFALLRQGEIDKGLSFLPKLRKSQIYPFPYRSVNQLLIEAGRVDDVLAIASRLEDSEKPNFYRSMARPWVRFELDSLLEYLPKLPTAETRELIATSVLRAQESYPYLTEAEVDFVRSFISDETN